MSTFIASARIAFLDTVRRPGFWIGAVSFLAAAGLAAYPFSPGIPADPEHYLDAGTSTLLMGAIFLSLMLVPVLLTGSGGEGIQALPAGRGPLTGGIYAGFSSTLILYFLAGHLVLSLVQPSGHDGASTFFSLFDALLAAAVVLFTSRLLPFAPAVMAAVLIITLGYTAAYLPQPIAVLLPAFDRLDPLTMRDQDPGQQLLALINGLTFIGFFLTLAAVSLRRRLAR